MMTATAKLYIDVHEKIQATRGVPEALVIFSWTLLRISDANEWCLDGMLTMITLACILWSLTISTDSLIFGYIHPDAPPPRGPMVLVSQVIICATVLFVAIILTSLITGESAGRALMDWLQYCTEVAVYLVTQPWILKIPYYPVMITSMAVGVGVYACLTIRWTHFAREMLEPPAVGKPARVVRSQSLVSSSSSSSSSSSDEEC